MTKDLLDAGLETIETRMEGRIASLESRMDSKFAELRTEMHIAFNGMTKWLVATMIAVAAISVSLTAFFVNNAAPRVASAAPAPIVIYAQPPESGAEKKKGPDPKI